MITLSSMMITFSLPNFLSLIPSFVGDAMSTAGSRLFDYIPALNQRLATNKNYVSDACFNHSYCLLIFATNQNTFNEPNVNI